MPSQSTSPARGELQAWYLHGLLPKLARAVLTGAVDRDAIEALDADVRALLDLSRAAEEAPGLRAALPAGPPANEFG